MKNRIVFVVMIFISYCCIHYLYAYNPKREFRGAWIATVVNLDWPCSPRQTSLVQQQDLVSLIDQLKQAGFNAIILQVRDECDAFYASQFDPWSYYLTGAQGKVPDPFYDPLTVAIAAAHERGMELHAWFNPYRAEVTIGAHDMAENHVSNLHPDWIYIKANRKLLDPGLPQVREYVKNVISDVVDHYDIDGIHFDDYFYPYEIISTEDSATFANYSRGFTSIDDWRRDNVNLLIEQVYQAITAIKPHVKFGVAPFGIWKYNVPPGISGFSAYDGIYCDPIAWLNAQTVDYIAPQCYWPHGDGQDYRKLVQWWATKTNGRNLYIGQAAYRIGIWQDNEINNQIQVNRTTKNISGSIFFRTRVGILDNPKGFLDCLKNDLYRTPAFPPLMPWKDDQPPHPPQNVRYEHLAISDCHGLTWDLPLITTSGDTVIRFAVYRFDFDPIDPAAIDNPSNMVQVVGDNFVVPACPSVPGPFYYVITALDRLWNESNMSNVLMISPPGSVELVYPPNNSRNLQDTIALAWSDQETAAAYHLQIALDSTFSRNMVLEEYGLVDTVNVLVDLKGQLQYFWRVNSMNAGGLSVYSDIFNFTTGFPEIPALVYPANRSEDISLHPTLVWHSTTGATNYDVQISTQGNFNANIKLDKKEIADTLLTVGPLKAKTIHYWRVRAKNSFGSSKWSEPCRFTVGEEEIPELAQSVILYQNYPNPFNNQTTFSYELTADAEVTLTIINIEGQLIETLVAGFQEANSYSVTWNASPYGSGIYFYRLEAGSRISIKKCTLLK